MPPTTIFKSKRGRSKRPRSAAYTQHATADYERAREKQLFGSLGAASPVKKIDPRTGKIVAVIDPQTGLPMRPGIKRMI
jgi:hypothetical protein